MEIERNGKKIELTDWELMQAHDEWNRQCAIQDVITLCEQKNVKIPENDVRDIASDALHGLSKSDPWFEAYWAVFEHYFEEYLKKREE